MQKDTWIIIGFMVTLVGLLATFMVTGLTSIESRLTAMDNRLAAMDGRLHEMNTRLSRIEGHLRSPAEVEPIRFETMGEVLPQLARMEENPARSLMSTGHSGSACPASSWVNYIVTEGRQVQSWQPRTRPKASGSICA